MSISIVKQAIERYKTPFILLCIAFLSRALVLGNPFVEIDEQFYLFTGGRLLQGDLPYISVWDRKPVGIFIIYAFFHMFGTWRIWAYQVGAVLCVWFTSLLVLRTARLIAPAGGAFLAAILYMIWTGLAHGEGGQSPIFYNLLVALAMMLLAYRLPQLWSHPSYRFTGLEVMILFGVAMQIKYTAVFEGVYAGLVLLWSAYRAQKSWSAIILYGGVWILCALAPTMLVWLFYIIIGHGHDWWFANVESIFLRQSSTAWHDAKWMLVIGSLLLLPIICHYWISKKDTSYAPLQRTFLVGWAISALLGVAVFGGYFKHYALPLMAPCLIVAASLWTRKLGRLYLIFLLIFGTFKTYKLERKAVHGGDITVLNHVRTLLSSPAGCVFGYNGPSVILDVAHYCPLTRYPFPAHLRLDREKNALGVDPLTEVKHIFDQKPLYIMSSEFHHTNTNDSNPDVNRFVSSVLRKDYENVYIHSVDAEYDNISIYKRKSP